MSLKVKNWTFSTGVRYALSPTETKQATAIKIEILQDTQKKIQNIVRPTRFPRQQWPLLGTKNGDIAIVFSVGSG